MINIFLRPQDQILRSYPGLTAATVQLLPVSISWAAPGGMETTRECWKRCTCTSHQTCLFAHGFESAKVPRNFSNSKRKDTRTAGPPRAGRKQPTCPSIALPSGFQILASPSTEDDSKDAGDRIHDRLETAAECAFQAAWKTEEGTAKLYPPAASFAKPFCACLAGIAGEREIAKRTEYRMSAQWISPAPNRIRCHGKRSKHKNCRSLGVPPHPKMRRSRGRSAKRPILAPHNLSTQELVGRRVIVGHMRATTLLGRLSISPLRTRSTARTHLGLAIRASPAPALTAAFLCARHAT